ncbi:MAG: hypothetical protein DRH37_01175, partial [Deltaproteobacteria bacterium]
SAANTSYRLRARVSGNEVRDNSATGISCYADRSGRQDVEIRANRVYANGGNGIQYFRRSGYTGTMNAVVALNSIHDNTGHGLYGQSDNAAKVLFNNIYANGGSSYDFYNASASPVDGRFNFWGSATTSEMDGNPGLINIQRIYDLFDDAAMGLINYSPYLASAVDTGTDIITRIFQPLSGDTISEGMLTLRGVAYARHGIDRVEISLDNGATWDTASFDPVFSGKTLWYY